MLDVQELGAYINRHFTRTLFRLETLDQYEVASDGSDFARHLAGDLAERPDPGTLVDHDFWLIDERAVLRMHYDRDGQFAGAEQRPEHEVAPYRSVRDSAWQAAVPFESYWAGHPEYWRDEARRNEK